MRTNILLNQRPKGGKTMSQIRVLSSILKRTKSTVVSNLRGKASSRFSISCSSSSSSSFFSSTIARSSVRGFKSLPKGHHVPSFRKMSTVASVAAGNKEGLKLLVSGGTRAQKMVGIWLFGSAAWVFSMVVLSGVTRLTRSGLSMTNWKLQVASLRCQMRSGCRSLRSTSSHRNINGSKTEDVGNQGE